MLYTILRNRDRNRYVLYLNWNGKQWVVNVYWLDNNFNRNDRFVRRR